MRSKFRFHPTLTVPLCYEIPPHVEYSFSKMGRDLMPVFYAIMVWGFKHEKDIPNHK